MEIVSKSYYYDADAHVFDKLLDAPFSFRQIQIEVQ